MYFAPETPSVSRNRKRSKSGTAGAKKPPPRLAGARRVPWERIGDPNPKLVAGRIAGTSDERLIEIGRTIDTKRIVTDAIRIYGEAWAWWQAATPAEHKLVRGVSRALLAIAVHSAVELESLRASIEDSDVHHRSAR